MTQQQLIVNSRRNLLISSQRQGIAGACKIFGVSRTTFYKIKKQFVETGSLEPRVRRKPRMPNETSLSKKKLLLDLIKERPNWGIDRYSYAFRQKGISFARYGIYASLRRFGLSRRFQRLIYVETLKSNNQPVTERNIKKLKKHFQTIQHGQWPGHIVALDTFLVGHLKGVGRIYQVTGIDLCSRYGWAQLYTSKGQVDTINFVEQILVPKFFNNNIDIESILTDNGSEFIGHKFTQMLQDYDIRHIRIKPGKPILNGYCERFQRTILEEFYQPEFRKTFFKSLQTLQEALDEYLVYYNFERAHFGLDKLGEIPINIFKSKISTLRHRFQNLLT